MVRVKKRYFVVEFQNVPDLRYSPEKFSEISLGDIPESFLASLIKEKIQDLFGDIGRATVSGGLRVITIKPDSRLVIIQARHGPHKYVGGAIPFLTKLKDHRVIPRLIYTGATLLNCYKRMKSFHEGVLNSFKKQQN